jgi:hypothetical protein
MASDSFERCVSQAFEDFNLRKRPRPPFTAKGRA